ncbi:DUF1294 domain-containing protein [Sediminibacillus massiliensis]|uniref:DUF1294 domain-containing protein n=1 Tax=Sediminibacillus massiliensis TaxID=1926277 RepID=UPI001FEC122B|nr:DUF1294 domain-containing protein [Sediminibacillus massiliensis]
MDYFLLVFGYMLVMSLISFLVMGSDKRRSKKRKWRIPEKNIWLISILGGAAGSYLGMYFFRHKTRHTSFRIGIPLLLIIQIVVLFTGFR